MATERRKKTVRLDPPVDDGFARVCEINGDVSATALFQAWAEVMISESERHDWRPLPEWDDYPPAAAWLYERAQQIKTERRERPHLRNRGRHES